MKHIIESYYTVIPGMMFFSVVILGSYLNKNYHLFINDTPYL